jgi:endoribonuclease Nob1
MPGTTAKFILDSSFFLSGIQPPEGDLFTVPKVVDEIRPDRKELAFSRALGLQILDPDAGSLKEVKKTSMRTGDVHRLSEVDIELVALSLQLHGTLLTDDYSMQNVAKVLNIEFRGLGQKGITKIETWYYRCKYCGQYQGQIYKECPTCGGPMRTTRKPPRKGKHFGPKQTQTSDNCNPEKTATRGDT